LAAYQTSLELSIYLKEKNCKIVSQNCQVAGPGEMVVAEQTYDQLKNDLIILSEEVRNQMAQNSRLEKEVADLQATRKDLQASMSKKQNDLLDLTEKLNEKIKEKF